MTSHAARAQARRAPDLLFEEQQRARIRDLAPLLEYPERITAGVGLHRMTVFLTYACNLACIYCKTIAFHDAPAGRRGFDLAGFDSLLDAHTASPVRHLHLTGGEAATVRGVVDMVRRARQRGVRAISMTSNGTLGSRLYLDLIAAGLDELRISLDASDDALGAALTRRSGAFAATLRTLAELAEARRGGVRFVLILNAVVGVQNRHRLAELVRFLLGFLPDDVKLITEADLRDGLGDFPEAPAVRAEIAAELSRRPPETLPLLRRKLETVFAPEAIGLPSTAPVGGRPGSNDPRWRCYVPLTERTLDIAHYYPCSVYLREGGEPLGSLSDPPDLQRRRSATFVREADCQADPICRRYCLHCTRLFNDRANAARP